MEQLILSVIMHHMEGNSVIRLSHQDFMEILLDEPNLLVWQGDLFDKGKAVDVVYVEFSKAFDTASHKILLGKLAYHGLDGRLFIGQNMAEWSGLKSSCK